MCEYVCVGVHVCLDWEDGRGGEGALHNQMASINKLTIYFGSEWHFVENGDTWVSDTE